MRRDKLLLATGNRGKQREYKSLLRGISFDIVTPSERGINVAVDESGGSFEENARLKAVAFADASGLLALADDSGLEVDALGGEPGPLSARYAGEGASDSDRISYLLSRLKDVPEKRRMARFRCVIALAEPAGKVEIFSGECRGVITTSPRGAHGFGYDPVFFLPELGKTMAELTVEEKNRASHRARAAEKARVFLMNLQLTS
ncbi:MAG: non-canonical purine NTP pyrophosphatase, RdgB/HAM1 family [Chloroflexi bacterium RBG_16_56_11]|nr:MAG: non-canonical purine NTP pyrophosphatase, RdgB/HAM1 family [Chloroflexi bacterium RBG_16_56_11]